MDMSLEADLGIDSIKRVEILSAIQEQAPDLPEVDANEMAALQTLGQVLAYMEAHAGDLVSPAAGNGHGGNGSVAHLDQAPNGSNVAEAPAVNDIDLSVLLMDVVAEKTGYPQEILKMEMSLEADLGIDSIKRVEILSAVQERFPELPEVDATEMASLQTLGEVLGYMQQQQAKLGGNGEQTVSAAARPSNGKAPKVERRRVQVVATPATGNGLKGLQSCRKVVVTDEEPALAEELVLKLVEAGVPAEVGSAISDRIDDSVDDSVDGLIFLGGLSGGKNIDTVSVSKKAFAWAKGLASRLEKQGGIFVTVQDTGGDFGLGLKLGDRAWLAGLPGLVKTAALEWPAAGVRAIDIDRSSRDASTLAAALAGELLNGGDQLEVGLRADGTRLGLDLVRDDRQALLNGTHRIEENAVFVVSGRARGVTAASLLPLARNCRARLLILGRTVLNEEAADTSSIKEADQLKKELFKRATATGATVKPAEIGAQVAGIMAQREVRANLDALRQAGAEVLYAPVDVTDVDAVTQVVDDARARWGRIDGLIHGAGVLADKRIADKTEQQFARVFETKVLGLRALLLATEDDALTTLCLFSSVAARFGNFGQCDYAMANEVLNKVALAEAGRRNGRCLVKSVNWEP